MKTRLLLAACALSALASTAVSAQTTPAPNESVATVYGGYNSPTGNYQDRYYGGVTLDKYVGDLGVHVDAAAISREEDGVFASVGLSHTLVDGVRGRFAVGGSTDNRSILPKYYGMGQLRFDAGAKSSITPSLSYRKYRTGVDEYQPAVDAVTYFSLPGDANGYFALQARGAYAIHRGKDAPSGGLGITAIRKGGISLGVYGEYGRLAYANLADVGAPGIDTSFYAVRPSVGFRLNRSIELVARGEFSHNRYYETRGILVGFKAHLG